MLCSSNLGYHQLKFLQELSKEVTAKYCLPTKLTIKPTMNMNAEKRKKKEETMGWGNELSKHGNN